MKNLEIWNRFADIDPAFTKPITGKPYKGTSPNPHYVIRCLTEMFGPVGQGFGWEVVAEGFQPLGAEVLHWCRIRFWHGDSKGFDAYGQTKAVMIKRDGSALVDEDAPKKSLTDAITKAASQIGIASNIFLGRWDDSGYVAQVDADYRREDRKAEAKRRESEKNLIFVRIVKAMKDKTSIADLQALMGHPKTLEALEALPPALQAEIATIQLETVNELEPQAPREVA